MSPWKGMNQVQRGEDLWDRAGAMDVEEGVRDHGSIENAVEAALTVLAQDMEFGEYPGDAAHDMRMFIEHEMVG